MKKLTFIFWLLVMTGIAMFNSCNTQTTTKSPIAATYPAGVVINGVRWATCNVDMPGTFAPTPESAGKFYQCNRKVAWNTTDEEVENWDSSIPEGTEWIKGKNPNPDGWRILTLDDVLSFAVDENRDSKVQKGAEDPSPESWRVPTLDEIKSLIDTAKVSNEWTVQNGVNGSKFTDKTTGASLFLPAVGYRERNTGTLGGAGESGCYWSSTQIESSGAFYLFLNSVPPDGWSYDICNLGHSLRPVAE